MDDQSPAARATVSLAARFDVFLSHNSRDKPIVERIAERLKRTGLEPWLDKWSLTPGGRWQEELAAGLRSSAACAVCIGPADLGDWEREELGVAQDRATKDRDFRLFLVLLPGLPEKFDASALLPFLSTRTWVDLRGGLDDARAFQSLVNAIKGVPLGPEVPIEPVSGVPPYRGLEVFDEEHSEFFFGREGDVQRLVEKLKASRFLTVIGPSGGGKSSLVRAGLIPALRRGALPGSESWTVEVLRPGAHPLDTLSARLVGLYRDLAGYKTRDELRADAGTLRLLLSRPPTEVPKSTRVVCVVDQFEEVFTLCRDEEERKQFLLNLLQAAAADGPSTIVLTLRADFYAHCAVYPEFAQQIATHQYLVGPMEPDGLRQAIEEPARRVGLEFEAGLVATILDDVEGEPGALPLLQQALLELWERRRGRMLTLEAYRESGGVAGAIAKRADAIYAAFTPEEQAIARQMFLRLTQPGEGTEDTRRRAAIDELASHDNDVVFESVLRVLVDARMLTTSGDNGEGGRWVDVSHEALIRGWPRLRAWIDQDRAGLIVHRRITEAAEEWQRLDRDKGTLYRGARLAEALEWCSSSEDLLNELEREFLGASRAAEQSELQREKRRTRRLRALAGSLAVLLAISGAAAIVAVIKTADARSKQRLATSQGRVATSRQLVAEQRQVEAQPDLDLLVALQALRFDDSAEGRAALLDALQRRPRLAAIVPGQEGQSHVAFSPDGRILASAGEGAVVLWDMVRNRQWAKLRNPDTEYSDDEFVGFSDDGQTVWVTQFNRRVLEWSVPEKKLVADVTLVDSQPSALPVVSPDGTIAAAPDRSSGRVGFWSVRTGERVKTALSIPSTGRVLFSPDGRLLLVVNDAKHTTAVWDLRTGQRLRTFNAQAIALSVDGRRVAAAEAGGLSVWDSQTWRRIVPAHRYRSTYFSALSPDLHALAIQRSNNSIAIWNIDRHRARPGSLRAQFVNDLAFSPDGRTLASQDEDGQVLLWNVAEPGGLARVIPVPDHLGGTEGGLTIAYSPEGRRLAAADSSRVVLWDRATLQTPRQLRKSRFVGFAADGALLFAQRGRLVYSDDDGHELGVIQMRGILDGVTAISPSGRTFALFRRPNELMIWDLPRRSELSQVKLQYRPPPAPDHLPPGVLRIRGQDEVESIAFSGDDQRLAVGDYSGGVRIFDRDGGLVTRVAPQGNLGIDGLALDDSGAVLATTTGNSTDPITVWDVAQDRLINAPKLDAVDFIFSPRGELLAVNSGGIDDALLVHGTTGRPIGALEVDARQLSGAKFGDTAFPEGLAFAPDGRSLALISWDPTRIVVWDTDLGSWIRRACGLVDRNLTRDEWNQFVGSDKVYEPACPGLGAPR